MKEFRKALEALLIVLPIFLQALDLLKRKPPA
jgi:hypothetical protein